jgi:hypothetical protein
LDVKMHNIWLVWMPMIDGWITAEHIVDNSHQWSSIDFQRRAVGLFEVSSLDVLDHS